MISNATSIGLRTLIANPLRTCLSTLGVVVGCGALVAVLSMADGVEEFAKSQISETTDLELASIVSLTNLNLEGLTIPRADTVHLSVEHVFALGARLEGLASVTLQRTGTAMLGGFGDDSLRGAQVHSQGAGTPEVEANTLAAGRWFLPDEVSGAAPIAIVSPGFAARLVGSADPGTAVGRRVTLQGVEVEVVGVTAAPQTARMVAWVPITIWPSVVLQDQSHLPPRIVIRARSIDAMPEVLARTDDWLAVNWGPEVDGLVLQSRRERIDQAAQGMLIFKLLMGSITGVSLIVGGIGIMNVLLASVFERTREIGIRRATGARRRDIVTQFLGESVLITALGALLGTLLGFAVAFGVAALMRAQTGAPVHAAVTPTTILIAAGSAVFIGVVFGLYPALHAANLSPIEAIRTE